MRYGETCTLLAGFCFVNQSCSFYCLKIQKFKHAKDNSSNDPGCEHLMESNVKLIQLFLVDFRSRQHGLNYNKDAVGAGFRQPQKLQAGLKKAHKLL